MEDDIVKNRFSKISLLLIISLVSLTMLAGCSTGEETDNNGTVKLGYVNWAEGVAMTNLAKVILEDKMDYEVEMTMADPGAIFTSISSGDYDAFLDAWLPVTHQNYMEKYGEDLVDLGYNFEGARIGLVVPEYVEIDTIEELNEVADDFDGQIIGIDSGAGIMGATEKAIEEYNLDIELLPGSGPVMTATLKDAIENEEPVVVTGWKPHWKFARWDLKFLEDSKGVYGDVENIHTVVRTGLKDDMPEVSTFLENFYLDDQQLGSLMGVIADSDKEPDEAAREWMEENEELVNSWIEE